jgi:hypothetical protein
MITICCPKCGCITDLRKISGLQCSHCDYVFKQYEVEQSVESGLQKEANEKEVGEKVSDDKNVNRKCIPVLKTEGWIFWCLHTLVWKFPREVLKYLEIALIKLWKLEIYINWCIVASILRMVIMIGAPILIIYTGTLLRFDSQQHANEALGLVVGIILLAVAWITVFFWLSESYDSDVTLVRNIVLYDGSKKKE